MEAGNLIRQIPSALLSGQRFRRAREHASTRARRIGQTKSVFVYKLIAADTVEGRILELQERTVALASIAFGGDGLHWPAMGEEEVEFLFGASANRLAA